MTGRTALLLAAVLACLCLAVTVGAAGPAAGPPAVALDNHTNDSHRPIHENPDEVGEDGDQDALGEFIEGRLADRLEGSAISISEGEYDRARDLLGEEYESDLERYVELEEDGVTGGGGSESESSRSEELRETAEQQSEYADQLAEYQRLQEEYEQARAAGDDQRARELARELVALSERLTDLGVELDTRYERIENVTGRNLDDGQQRIRNTTETVRLQTEAIRLAEFDPVSVVATADGPASFTDPATVSVTVTDENGTAVDGGRVVLVDGDDRTVEAPVENGTATVDYRPVLAPVGDGERPLRYRPQNDSRYLGNDTTVDVVIEGVDASLSIDAVSEAVTYGQQATADVSVSVDGTPVPGYPVRGTFAGESTTASTDDAGTGSLSWRVNETTPAGDLPVVADGPEERAVTVESVRQSVTVEPSQSTIEVDAAAATPNGTRTDDAGAADQILVDVTLQTDAGTPVDGAVVDIERDGEVVGSVRTNDDGTAAAAISLPDDRTNVSVGASFDPSGGALEPSRDETTLSFSSDEQSGVLTSLLDALVRPLPLAVGSVLVLVGGGALLARRRAGADDDSGDAAVSDDSADEDEPTGSRPTVSDRLSVARETVDGNPDDATVLAYSAARSAIAARSSVDDEGTHWAFYRACEGDGVDPEDIEALATLTERYELAAYAAESVDSEAATDAVERAETVVDPDAVEMAGTAVDPDAVETVGTAVDPDAADSDA